jgi:cation:H+ antiporter
MGTSLPELIVAVTGAQSGNNEIALGNIIGTNMFNLCVILAVLSIIKPVKFLKETVRKDMYMTVVTAFVLLVLMADTIIGGSTVNMISRADGLILLVLFGVFIYYTLYNYTDLWNERKEKKEENEVKLKLKDIDKLVKNICLMILGLVMVFLGARWAVESVENIAVALKISETFIAILVVAIGTSLPEIFTSIAAMKKGKIDMAIGNLIGSNIFNILLILGLAATIHPIDLEVDSLLVDAFTFLIASSLCIIFTKIKGKYEFSRPEGISLLVIYVAYITYVIIRG